MLHEVVDHRRYAHHERLFVEAATGIVKDPSPCVPIGSNYVNLICYFEFLPYIADGITLP